MHWPTNMLTLSTGLKTRILDTGGAGVPVVLIHGLAASIEIWEKVIPLLARERRVIAFDLPGFGEADRPDAAYDAPFFVAQLKGLLDMLSLDRAHLVGSSLGASLIVRFSDKNLHRIERAVLAAPGGFGAGVHPFLKVPTLPLLGYALGRPMWLTNAFAVRLAMADPRFATRALIDLADRFSKRPGGHRAFVRTLKGVVGPLGVRDRQSFEQQARAMNVPTLVVWGDQDRLFDVRQSSRANELLPNARVERLARCGHYPQWERPDAFADLVSKHLVQLAKS